MTLDPRVGVYLNILLGVLTSLLGATALFTQTFGPTTTVYIMGGLGITWCIVNAILHSIPSQNTPEAAKQFYLGPK